MSEIQLVEIASIIGNTQTQLREHFDNEVILDYKERMQEGDDFPAITLYYDGTHYYCADGWHRVYGAKGAGLTEIAAEVTQGSLHDALLAAAAANQDHGLRRTRADKRRAVEAVLEQTDGWSARQVAQWCGVSHTMVNNILSPEKPAGDAKNAGGVETVSTPHKDVRNSKDAADKDDGENQPKDSPPAGQTDSVGTPIPEGLLGVFSVCPAFADLMKRMRAIKKEGEALAEEEGGSCLVGDSWSHSCQVIIKQLELSQPWAVVDGAWLTKGEYKSQERQ